MKNKILFIFFALSFVLPVLTGCQKKSRFKIDTNVDRVDVKIHRFDEDILRLDTSNIDDGIRKLYNKYPDFFPQFVSFVLDIDPGDTLTAGNYIKSFLTDTTFAGVNRNVLLQYNRVDDIEHSLSEAFTYIHHYFPVIEMPGVYFFVSGFNLSVMMMDYIIGAGVDMYLGADYPLYDELTYKYIQQNMNRANIAPDLVSALLFKNFRMDTDKGRLIDEMLYRGKVMYLLSVVLPDEKEENLMGYTPEQMEWSKKYEKEAWAAIVDQKHLFSTDNILIRKYVNDAPFTSTVSQDSPGRLGTWIGWQIIESYMNRNEEITLQELMRNNDYQKILEESNYRP